MKTDTTIFAASTRMSFGAGAKYYEVSLRGNFLMFKEGEPQTGGRFEWGIKDCPENIISEISNLEKTIDSGDYIKEEFSPCATHYFSKTKWLAFN